MEQFKNKVIQGDCLEKLKELEDNSVDSIVTDPPYHLVSIVKRFGKENSAPAKFGTDGAFSRASKGFMGKDWDGVNEDGIGIAQKVELWKECLRVLKPGGHLLAFSGTRTYHRMASAIEDAGFEVRDMIEWVYGCLSEDTEVLTKEGFKHFHKITQDDIIRVYDTQNDIYKWEKPQRWSQYAVEQDTAYRIKSDTTDQIVSRNHNCLVEREGKLVFIKSEDLLQMEQMPVLSGDISILQEGQGELLHTELLWQGEGLAETILSERIGQEATRNWIEGREEPSVERGSDLQKEEGEVCRSENKICEMSTGVSNDVKKGRICNGTQTESCTGDTKTADKNGVCASYQSQRNGQQDRELDVVQDERGTQEIRTRTTYNTTLATVEKIEYSGIIFCPTVSTGAFVARRNGQVFITGNSGFPKSHNIGKNIEKIKVGGIKNLKQIGTKKGIKVETGTQGFSYSREYVAGKSMGGRQISGDIPVYEINNEWEGWGTALKPAHEPICMARKPLAEKTVAENVLKYGTGGINIDESRVGTSENITIHKGNKFGGIAGTTLETFKTDGQSLGRFPANLIHDNSEEVRECFPESTSGARKAGFSNKDSGYNASSYEMRVQWDKDVPAEKGNASRFFKSIKKDLQYSPKHAILKLCENNISVNNAENNLKTTSQIELVASIFSALKSATPNLDLLNQNLNALFVEKSADSIEIDFVAKCVAIKEIPEELVSQQDYTVFRDFMEDYKKCSQIQNPVSVEKWGNIDITQIMISLLKLCGYVHLVIGENINSENREEQKCEYKSLVYIPKASKSERNKGCEELEEKVGIRTNAPRENEYIKTPTRKNNHPTVKPLKLMEYLIKMVTKPGGIVLDPFAGSGSTLVAAKQNGFQYIGIEMTEEYISIINSRLNHE